MKKIVTFLFAFMMMIGMATAQTVERPGVFSNMYIGINGGATYNPVSGLNHFDANKINYVAGLELGKDVTPITGFSLNASTAPIYTHVANENGSGKFGIESTNLTGNVKFNLMNLFGKYNGQPRVFEIKTVTGIGWDHNFNSDNPNDMSLNAGLEFDFNMGKQRAWYINFTPQVVSHNIVRNFSDVEPAVKNADLQATLGVVYRFGSNKTHSHNFVICDKVYTEEQYATLYNMYDECMSRPVQVDTVVVEKIVENIVETPTALSNAIIVFPKGKSELTEAEIHRLDIIMASLDKNGTYVVCGSADSGTGTEEINANLSEARAALVKEIMEKNGFKNVETTTKIDSFNDAEISRCAIIRIK